MDRGLLHTPEGVRDIYSEECEKKLVLEDLLLKDMRSCGFHPIQTPSFEYFDIFGKEIGSTPSKDLYKFFDREGNTLVLRPDMTPSIARSASKYYMETSVPLRFCYIGNTYVNSSSLQGRLKECTQAGAELIGEGSVDGDAELIALSVRMLKSAGLKEFRLGVGHVGYLQGLFAAAGMDEEKEAQVKELILNKNFYGVIDMVSQLTMDEDLIYLFALLGEFSIGADKLKEACQRAAAYPDVYDALKRLIALDELLAVYGISQYISYDMAMMTELTYYTGVIFAGYTHGTGEAIVKGGRYDRLLKYFGKDSPAIGFVIVVDQLMAALSRQNIAIDWKKNTEWIIYDEKTAVKAIGLAEDMRKEGRNVELFRVSDRVSRDELVAATQTFGVKSFVDITE